MGAGQSRSGTDLRKLLLKIWTDLFKASVPYVDIMSVISVLRVHMLID